MSTASSSKRLVRLTRDLSLKWRETRRCWQDAKSREFEKRFIEELMAAVRVASDTIGGIDKLMRKVRNDCE
jgi:hypothetical protein